jgi:hypothetical protein
MIKANKNTERTGIGYGKERDGNCPSYNYESSGDFRR